MNKPEFDPAEAVTFDLAYGHVHLDGAPTRIMVPAGALLRVCQAAGEDEAASLAYAMGEAMGRRVAVRLANGSKDRPAAVRAAGLERVVEHLAGELALVGLGALGAERWGRALVLVVDQSPLGDEGDELVEAVLQAALHAMSGAQHARVIKLQRDGVRARFVVVGGNSVEQVRERIEAGESWGAVLAALHGKGPPA